MPVARTYHGSATMGNRWYVAGGDSLNDAARFSPEVDAYDPATGQWTMVGALSRERSSLTGIVDPIRRRVLFIGGFLPAGPDGYLALANCDAVVPGGVAAVPSLIHARTRPPVAFSAGRFFVAGSWGMDDWGSYLRDDAEVWDGSANAWTPAGAMPGGARSRLSVTALGDGRNILLVGGCQPTRVSDAVDLFDVTTGTWRSLRPLNTPRCSHAAALLVDGRILITGGQSRSSAVADSSAELFDPSTERWTTVASMHDPRFDHDIIRLPDGRVLVAGGSTDPVRGEYGALASAEIYDPATDTWTLLPAMHDRRRAPTSAVLSDGVYIAGGSYTDTTAPLSAVALASVERLSWQDLGINPPEIEDAGVSDAANPDVDAADAGTPIDAAGPTEDGASAADAVSSSDAAPPPRGNDGCSCSSSSLANQLSSAGAAMLLLCALVVRWVLALRPRARSRFAAARRSA